MEGLIIFLTMKQIGIAAIILVICIAVLSFFLIKPEKQSEKTKTEVSPTAEESKSTEDTMKQPKMTIDKSKKYTATLKTEKGDIVVELNAAETPITVNNFVSLAKKNFYNNTIFHRTIKGFMIQGGDPTGTGTGGPGYRFDDEPFVGEYTRGTIAMANAGPDTNGSQFFIMHKDVPLQKDYVIFGKVVKGLEVVDAIAEAPTEPTGEQSTPVTAVKIVSIEITQE